MGTEIRFYVNRTGKDWKTENDIPKFDAAPKAKTDEAVEKWRQEFFKYIENNCLFRFWNNFPVSEMLRMNPRIRKTGDHFFGELSKEDYDRMIFLFRRKLNLFERHYPNTKPDNQKSDLYIMADLEEAIDTMTERAPDWTKEKVYIWII